ncbi:MAG: acetyltransferase [Gammaproteobacteria bacterium]|nr:acetyltransferase [Gammaproteobacteria bacterium]
MKNGLLIVGAGGHGKVVADAALLQAAWQKIAFVDRDPNVTETLGLPVFSGEPADDQLREDFSDAVVAIGNAATRLTLLDSLHRMGYRLPVIQHPRAVVSTRSEIGPGSVLFANAVVNPDCVLGRGCIVNTAATIDHDCVLAEGVHIAPGAHLAGGVRVGRATWIGLGACVREYLSIGDEVTIGAGAVVVNDIRAGQCVAGVPARPDFGSNTRQPT